MLRTALSITAASLVPTLIPSGISAQEDCVFCIDCIKYGYVDRMKTTEAPSNYLIAEIYLNCRPGDTGYCSEALPCDTVGGGRSPVDEGEVEALIATGDVEALADYVSSNRGDFVLLPERNLLLLKRRGACTERIARIYEVPGLRDAHVSPRF